MIQSCTIAGLGRHLRYHDPMRKCLPLTAIGCDCRFNVIAFPPPVLGCLAPRCQGIKRPKEQVCCCRKDWRSFAAGAVLGLQAIPSLHIHFPVQAARNPFWAKEKGSYGAFYINSPLTKLVARHLTG
jgi:hypothetical protein